MDTPPPGPWQAGRAFRRRYTDLERERRLLRAVLALALVALGVASGALCHVLRVLGC